MDTATLLQKRWNYRNALHHDGMSYGAYVGRLASTPSPAREI